MLRGRAWGSGTSAIPSAHARLRCNLRSTYHRVCRLVSLRLEVQIVVYRVVAALVCARENNLHIELAPTLLFDLKGWLLERYAESALTRIGK
jgi:hypothetical protein